MPLVGIRSFALNQNSSHRTFRFRRREDDEAVDAESDALAAAVVIEVFRHEKRVRLPDDPEDLLHGLLDGPEADLFEEGVVGDDGHVADLLSLGWVDGSLGLLGLPEACRA